MENVAFGQRVGPLEVERREHVSCDYGLGHIRGGLGDPRQDLVAELAGPAVPVSLSEPIGHVLHEAVITCLPAGASESSTFDATTQSTNSSSASAISPRL